MALVWGYDGVGWTTTDEGVQTSTGIAFAFNDDNGASITAVGSGSVSTGYLYISNWNLATAAKMAVYSAAGSLLGVSDPVASGVGTGLIAFNFSSPVAILSGTRYFTYIIPNTNYIDVRTNNAFAGFSVNNSAITYASPEASLPSPSLGNYKPFINWLDAGGGGGGGSAPVSWIRA